MGQCCSKGRDFYPKERDERLDIKLLQHHQIVEDDSYINLKFVMIGDANAGKTSIFRRLVESSFSDSTVSTTGIEFRVLWITVQEHRFKIYLWDTAGQERFRDLTYMYYRDADCFLVVYDMSSPKSMKNIAQWMKRVQEQTGESSRRTPKLMIGNKMDLCSESRSGLDPNAISSVAPDTLSYIEVSAKTGANMGGLLDRLGSVAMEVYRSRINR